MPKLEWSLSFTLTLQAGPPLPQDLTGEILAAGATQSASELYMTLSGAPISAADDFFDLSVLKSRNFIWCSHGQGANTFLTARVAVVHAIDIICASKRVAITRAPENIQPLSCK